MIKRLSGDREFLSDNRKSQIQKRPRGQKSVRLFAFSLALAICGAVSEAQQQAKIFKIGWLGGGSDARDAASTRGSDAIRRELRALGYVEGKNIAFEHRSADNKLERFPALADELVSLRVDVIVTTTTLLPVARKNATKTIPIVFLSVG